MPNSLPTSFDPSSLQPSAASLGRGNAGGAASDGSRLSHAAVEFESVLLGQWLQSAQKSFATVPGSEEGEDAGGDQMLGFATQQLAHAIASRGGLGIAKLVERALEKADSVHTANSPNASSATPKPSQQTDPGPGKTTHTPSK